MDTNHYSQISFERFDIITKRYNDFIRNSDDVKIEPIKVFDPLPQKHLDELELIRDVSRELQKKKDQDISKAAQPIKQEEESQGKKQTEDTEVQEK